MKCDEVLERAHDYFDRKLAAPLVEAIDAHVEGCPSCGELWRKARETTCREFTEFLGDYVEGSLSAERRRIFERHLSICKMCVDYLASYEASIRMARAAARSLDERTIEAMPEQLVSAILAARRKPG